MSALITIAFTVAFVMIMILNAHIVMARSLSPAEMLEDMEAEHLAKKLALEYSRFIEEKYQSGPYVKQMERASPLSGYNENYEKPINNIKELNNNLDDELKAIEEVPEPLPVAEALSNDDKELIYKKNGPSYHMTICHFKICNMGRKRDTHNQIY